MTLRALLLLRPVTSISVVYTIGIFAAKKCSRLSYSYKVFIANGAYFKWALDSAPPGGQGSKGDHGTQKLNVEGPVEVGLLLHSILLKRKTDYVSKILYELYGN